MLRGLTKREDIKGGKSGRDFGGILSARSLLSRAEPPCCIEVKAEFRLFYLSPK